MKLKPRLPVKGRRIVGLLQAAEYAGVSRWTLCVWIKQGSLPVIRFPGRTDKDLRGAKVDLDDLDEFIDRAKDRETTSG